MQSLKVRDVMTPDPQMISANTTVREAATIMKEMGFGVLPVGRPEKVLGILTDRDIAVRVAVEGEDPDHVLAREAMSAGHYDCKEEESLEQAAVLMRQHNVSRLLVKREEKIVGIVTLADLLRWPDHVRDSDKLLHILLGRGRNSEKSAA
jgi:CBS domain-containing protein